MSNKIWHGVLAGTSVLSGSMVFNAATAYAADPAFCQEAIEVISGGTVAACAAAFTGAGIGAAVAFGSEDYPAETMALPIGGALLGGLFVACITYNMYANVDCSVSQNNMSSAIYERQEVVHEDNIIIHSTTGEKYRFAL